MANVVAALVALSSMASRPAAPRMLGVFGDGMVLQHDRPLIHGCGTQPHDRIAACVGPCKDEIARGVADANGCFTLHLAPRPVFSGNRSSTLSIAVKISTGNASSPFFAHAHGVTFGHVILCGGQASAAWRDLNNVWRWVDAYVHSRCDAHAFFHSRMCCI